MSQPTPSSDFYDNTMLSSYKECPRKFFLRHVMEWRGQGTALPLVFGLAWHSAMSVVWKHGKTVSQTELPRYALTAFYQTWEEQGLPTELDIEQIDKFSPRTPSIAHEMLVNYVNHRWPVIQRAELLADEQAFAVPLPRSDNVWYVGRLDKVIAHQGQLLVLEHKTTTEYAKDGGFKTQYIEGWFSDAQVKGYQFGGGLYFEGLSQVWVDAALVHKTVHNAFRFVPVAHQLPLLVDWIEDTRNWVGRIQGEIAKYKAEGMTPGAFPKNEGACYNKFGRCPFLDICRTQGDPTRLKEVPEGYVKEKWEPFEILKLDKLIQGERNGTSTENSSDVRS